MARFVDDDLSGSEFREVVLNRSRFVGVVMQDAEIDGLVTNLVVNGVEVTGYVQAELDRRHPVRLLIRSDDPADLREGWATLRADWAVTLHRLAAGPPGHAHASVDGEWSAVQTLRHLLFVHDSWFARAVLGRAQGFHPWGLASDFVPHQDVMGLDPAAAPSLADVVAARRERDDALTAFLASATPDELARADAPGRPGLATADRDGRAGACRWCSTRSGPTTASACATSTGSRPARCRSQFFALMRSTRPSSDRSSRNVPFTSTVGVPCTPALDALSVTAAA